MVPAALWLLARGGNRGGTAGGTEGLARRAGLFAAGLAPLVALALFYNVYRWGGPFATGYLQTEHRYLALQTEGFVGLLLSPGRGFFWFSPVLLLAFPGFRRLWTARRVEAIGIALFAGAYVGFLGFVTVWNGDWTWGPRHLLPIVPVVALAMAPALEPGRWRRAVGIPLVAVSVLVQLVGISVNYETYYLWHNQWMRDTGIRERPGDSHFHASRSQIYVQFRQAEAFWRQLPERTATFVPGRDRGPYESILGGAPAITKRVPDLAWIYFGMAGVPGAARAGLGAACLGLIGMGAAGLRRTMAPPRRRRDAASSGR
ncbi:MAG: hypothetical protein HKN12_01860 [Gemmatimonadetes bacterium]|nr:hypothetical protein [Gemmatimonadota bacterium]